MIKNYLDSISDFFLQTDNQIYFLSFIIISIFLFLKIFKKDNSFNKSTAQSLGRTKLDFLKKSLALKLFLIIGFAGIFFIGLSFNIFFYSRDLFFIIFLVPGLLFLTLSLYVIKRALVLAGQFEIGKLNLGDNIMPPMADSLDIWKVFPQVIDAALVPRTPIVMGFHFSNEDMNVVDKDGNKIDFQISTSQEEDGSKTVEILIAGKTYNSTEEIEDLIIKRQIQNILEKMDNADR